MPVLAPILIAVAAPNALIAVVVLFHKLTVFCDPTTVGLFIVVVPEAAVDPRLILVVDRLVPPVPILIARVVAAAVAPVEMFVVLAAVPL